MANLFVWTGQNHESLTRLLSFPDFPGVVTAAPTIDEARRLAKQALALHVAGILEDGEAVPEPSSLDQVLASSDHSALTTLLVPLKTR
ncbi:type II toxin-antitoxin system HicB family antitoxin [Mesorhizobium sp. B1-1-8]|uniref:type II toxin-antitoxin system HicB family antitoxin n=1 Tax=Mesorhizobium sp. B1-1-8 TaxID=2589976 RepID=UPI00112A5336|nr:type II toxin-antitoxin system HicB family antitoxin [Mesorhizobium sp. B1-1-8]UCI09528.1 type II toxin-antitoxin system HicB family antitoxin [Mesorhizobium sp. B1-1-8]